MAMFSVSSSSDNAALNAEGVLAFFLLTVALLKSIILFTNNLSQVICLKVHMYLPQEKEILGKHTGNILLSSHQIKFLQ